MLQTARCSRAAGVDAGSHWGVGYGARRYALPLQCRVRLASSILRVAQDAHAAYLHAISIAAGLAERPFVVDPLGGLHLGWAFQCSFQEPLPDSGQFVIGRKGRGLSCHCADDAEADQAQ